MPRSPHDTSSHPFRRSIEIARSGFVPALCAAYLLYYFWKGPVEPVFTTDSAGYLGFAPVQRLGYPLFLTLVPPNAAMVVQPVLFVLALACLGLEIRRITSSALVAGAVVLASVSTPQLLMFHATILSESLFMSGLILFLAVVARFARAPSWRTVAVAATIAGATAVVRPTGVAFLAVLLAMVALQWRRLGPARWPALAAATVPMLALLAGERIAARAIHGDETTSLAGRHLYAKAGLVDAPSSLLSTDPLRARLEEHVNTEYVPIRDFLDRAPKDLHIVLTLYYESCLQGPCVPEEGVNLTWGSARLNEVLLQVALERIARAPLGFAALTATHYRSLWTADKLRHPDTARALNAFIASHRPLPFEREAFALTPETTLAFRPYEPVRFIQPIVILMGWMTGSFAVLGLAAIASRRALSPVASMACLAALAAHACLLFSALFAAGLARFIISVWPAIATSVVVGGWWTVSAVISGGTRATARSPE